MPKKDSRRDDMRTSILKEIASSGGLPQNRLSLEVLYLLPTEFIEQYTTLFFEALREDAKGTDLEARAGEMTDKRLSRGAKVARARNKYGVEGVQEAVAPVARGAQGEGTKRYRNAWVIRNEKALRLKSGVDRKLRELAEDITEGLGRQKTNAGNMDEAKCSGCGRYLKNNWRFCPSCGSGSR